MLATHLAAARRLGLDATTAEVVEAFREAGVPTLLFKGPVLERWLYPGGGRGYGDIDLLVSPESFARAEGALGELGFERRFAGARPGELVTYGSGWRRGPFDIDLHRTLWGVGVPAGRVWEVLSERTVSLELAGARVETPREAVQAYLAALHALKHGRTERKPVEDLRRALAVGDDALWREAADAARSLESSGAFAIGLGLVPEGEELADRLDLPRGASVEAHLFGVGPPPVSRALVQIAAAASLRAGVALLLSKLAPSPPMMRFKYGLARRGRLGLLAAYAARPFALCAQTPAAVSAVREARRRARAA